MINLNIAQYILVETDGKVGEILPGSLILLKHPDSDLASSLVLGVGEPDVDGAGLKLDVRNGEVEDGVVYKVYVYQVYLEAYRHHAKVLRNLQRVPFSRYIVDSGTRSIWEIFFDFEIRGDQRECLRR